MEKQTLPSSHCSSRNEGSYQTMVQQTGQQNNATNSATSANDRVSYSGSTININDANINYEPEQESVKVWKQLSQAERSLENALHDVVESATDLQRDLAVLLTKMATLFDPDIVEIISNNISDEQSSEPLGNGEERSSEEVNNEWDENVLAFEKINVQQPSE